MTLLEVWISVFSCLNRVTYISHGAERPAVCLQQRIRVIVFAYIVNGLVNKLCVDN